MPRRDTFKLTVKADKGGDGAARKRRPARPSSVTLRAGDYVENPLPLERLAQARAVCSMIVSHLPLWNELLSLYKHGGMGAGYGAEQKWKRLGYDAALTLADALNIRLRDVSRKKIGARRDDEPVVNQMYESPFVECGVPLMLVVNVWRGDRLRFDTINVSVKAFADGLTYAGFWADDNALTIPYFFVRYCGRSSTQPRCEVVVYRLK